MTHIHKQPDLPDFFGVWTDLWSRWRLFSKKFSIFRVEWFIDETGDGVIGFFVF